MAFREFTTTEQRKMLLNLNLIRAIRQDGNGSCTVMFAPEHSICVEGEIEELATLINRGGV